MNRRKKSLLCSCALNHNEQKHQQRQTITQHDAARRLFWPSPQPRKDKKKETTIKMDFSFVGERAPFLQSQRKMMARDAVARAPQCLVARAVGTRRNNPKESCVRIYQGKRKKQQSKWFYLSYSGEGAIS